ncbi:MAG: S-methyl-5-thioribose-1-phosphate isomerase [Halanaerobiaceae bacterium]|nr:S-methyl-5-thioribose-1-phosphate isomerase [Halanaerobiaceae bacterium]
MKYKTLDFSGDELKLLDQRKLPLEVEYYNCRTYLDIKFAISDMIVRGAPAIGATAAYGVYLVALEYRELEKEDFIKAVKKANEDLLSARPTAVNLYWAIKRMEGVIDKNKNSTTDELLRLLLEEANTIAEEDIITNRKIAAYGNEIVPEGAVILTHCNTGSLATVDYGTALGIIREAHYAGKHIKVFADETRPRLQGARLTAFELLEEGIPATLIPDSVAATLIRDGKIDLILVGADRIASNGDTANKIGTYMLSEIAKRFDVPFYVAAPVSTIDFDIMDGSEIVIEERSSEEVTHINGIRIAPEGIDVYNPAFDVTPAENISGIITEKGIAGKPYLESLAKFK